MKKQLALLSLGAWFMCSGMNGQNHIRLESPNGKLRTDIELSDKIYYTTLYGNDTLLYRNSLQMELGNETLGNSPQLAKQWTTTEQKAITPVIPLKYSKAIIQQNQLLLKFKNGYSVEFRAFNEGLAYRFITHKKGKIDILNEEVTINLHKNDSLHLQQTWNGFHTPYEEPYTHLSGKEFTEDSPISTLPVLVASNKNYKILISETNVFDYPEMLVRGKGEGKIAGVFPPCPLKQVYKGDDRIEITEKANYIAQTKGTREFPWRYFVITTRDEALIENKMMLALAEPSQITDTSWIQSGQTVWDWWNYAMPYDVDFVAGRNQNTYNYFIDFAADNHIPYTLIDDGWTNSRSEPFKPNPQVNIHEVLKHAKNRNVKVILWMHWSAIENNIDSIFDIYARWGVAGLKIDFMERNDQWMVNFYERVAQKAAANKMIILFHGAFKPSGLEYKYPNVLSYEAVRGLEWKGEATADNGIYLPFMRNAVGPMDYTPGAMVSMQPEYYANSDYNPAAIGTRALQLAHFIVFESGIQMLADNPTRYKKEKESFDFIKQIPTTWDETRVLTAKLGEYVVVAKRKGDKWYIGAMTNSRFSRRNIEIDLDFLPQGSAFRMVSFEDGPNANYVAMDYCKKETTVKRNQKLAIAMARNGGWAGIIEKTH